MMGMDVRMVAPRSLWNDDKVIKEARRIADGTGARITHTEDVQEGVRGTDFLYTDVWVSMGEPKAVWDQRIALLREYQVNMDMIRATGNADVRFMHCLPAFHDRNTKVGEDVFEQTGLDALEVTDEVFESQSLGRIRPGGEPDAHDQGDHARDYGRLSAPVVNHPARAMPFWLTPGESTIDP